MIRKVEKDCSVKGAVPIYCGIVEKIHRTSNGSDKRILLISDLFAAFYKLGSRPSVSRLDYWVELRRIGIEDDITNLEFTMSGDFTFSSPECETIRERLGDLLQRYLRSFERKHSHVECLTDNRVEQTRRGILARFLSCIASQELHINDKYTEYITKMLMPLRDAIVVPNYDQLPKMEKALLYALNGARGIDSVTIPGSHGSKLFEVMTDADLYPYQFWHIHFDKVKITSEYGLWCRMVAADPQSTLQGITFSDVSFRKEDFLGLQQVVIDRKMTSLGFINSIRSKHSDALLSSFLVPSVAAQLQLLTFNSFHGVPYAKMLCKVKDLYALSLADCDLNIYDVLKCVKESKMYKLRMLNLSKNKALAPSEKTVSFTDNLQRLDLCEVEWSDGSLVPIVSSAASKEWVGTFELNISSARASQTEWGACKLFMANHKKSFISSLVWNYNPVWPELMHFLEESAHLVTLEISNSFTKYDSTVMNRLGNIIKKCETLVSLIIFSDEMHDLGESLVSLIQATLESISLQNLVVTGNKIGDRGVNLLGDLVKNSELVKCVYFDGSGMSGINILSDFIGKCKHLHRSVIVEWPETDIERFLANGSITAEKAASMKGDLMKLYLHAEENNQEDSYDSPMAQPFEFFKYVPKSFPLYVSRSLGEYFKNPLKSFEQLSPRRSSPDLSQRRKSAMTIEVSTPPSRRVSVDNSEKVPFPSFNVARKISFDGDDEDISPRRASRSDIRRRTSVSTDDSDGSPSRRSSRLSTGSNETRRSPRRSSSSFDDDDEISPRRGSRQSVSRRNSPAVDDSYLCPDQQRRDFPIGSPSKGEHRQVMSKLKAQFSLEKLEALLAEEESL